MARLMAEPALASVRLQRPAPISELERAPAQVQVVQEVVGDIDDFLRDIPFFEKHLDFRALAKGLRDHNHSAEAAGLVLQAFATISNKDNRRDAARAAIGCNGCTLGQRPAAGRRLLCPLHARTQQPRGEGDDGRAAGTQANTGSDGLAFGGSPGAGHGLLCSDECSKL